MKKWFRAVLFVLPLCVMIAFVNWYVDSYAYLRVTYEEIGRQMVEERSNVTGLEESDFNDRNLLLSCLKQQEAKEVLVQGSSRVFTFEHAMFGTDSFYNAGLSESTIYDLLAVTGILVEENKLPEKMIIGVDAFLFNESTNNEKWKELESYEKYMEEILSGGIPASVKAKNIGTNCDKFLSLEYFRYNVTLLPEKERFEVTYTKDWEADRYMKHYDGSVAYQKELREVDRQDVISLTQQSIEEHVVYRLTDYKEIDAASLRYFEELLAYLQEEGVEVILYLPPYSPMMYDYIKSDEHFSLVFTVEERMKQIASDRGIALYGSYNPEQSGVEMTDLYDVYHLKTEKMMDTYFPVIPSCMTE